MDKNGSFLFGPYAETFPPVVHKDWTLTVIVNHENWNGLAIGYVQAAAVLIEQVDLKNQSLDRETAIFPIIYCYRHYIELTIKQIINWSEFMVGKQTIFKTHNLIELWGIAKDKITQVHLSEDQRKEIEATYTKIEMAVDDFNQHDQRSMSFRYPIDTKGKMHHAGLCNVNLAHLYEAMYDIHLAFESIIRILWMYVSFRQSELEGPPDDWYWEEDSTGENAEIEDKTI